MLKINSDKKVPPLKEGDEIITIAVSSAIDEDSLPAGLKIFKDWGLIPRKNKYLTQRWGYFAGSDEIRYKQLHSKRNPALTTFVRGGWGAARLLEKPQNWKPGWFLGYSDITSILFSRLSEGFDGCIHGPMINSIAQEPLWSRNRLKAILFGYDIPDLYGEPIKNGVAIGPLIAANLTVASHLIGTKHMPDLKGSILVLEDIAEEPYRIDRMLTQWRMTGLLDQLAGLCFGKFLDCQGPEGIPPNKTFSLNEVLKDRVKDLSIPVIQNLPIGHGKGNAALPLGKEALLDCNSGFLRVISS
tara:strand:- start:455 stop:1354 length:900 start_codon:yes stop_codon:yes gene_type:complete